jgi:hypothetical protein
MTCIAGWGAMVYHDSGLYAFSIIFGPPTLLLATIWAVGLFGLELLKSKVVTPSQD